MMMRRAFTLVELILTVTILTVLAGIAYISYQSYTVDARDAARKMDVGSVKSTLKGRFQESGVYTYPSSYFAITNSGRTVAYQGVVDNSTDYSKSKRPPKDPKVDRFYGYSVVKNRRAFQVAATLENQGNPLSYVDGDYKTVAVNVLPSLFVATGSSTFVEIGTGKTLSWSDGSTNRKLFIVDGSQSNLLYDLAGNTVGSWLTLSSSGAFVFPAGSIASIDTSNNSCSDIYYAGKSVGVGEYQIRSSDGQSIVNTTCSGAMFETDTGYIAPASSPSAYTITNSLLLNANSSQYLSKTFASAGNQKKWTWSGWVKRANIGSFGYLLYNWDLVNGANSSGLYFRNADQLAFWQSVDNSSVGSLSSTWVYRDPSAWYHVVAMYDSQQATAENRFIIWINGVEALRINTVPQWQNSWITSPTYATTIGRSWASGGLNYLDGYLADVSFVDSWALDASAFWQFDSTTGQWVPKAYSGDYGKNGFHLAFINSGSLGIDDAPISTNHTTANNWALPNAGTQTIDTPSNNFANLNPLNRNTNALPIISGGNLFSLSKTTNNNTTEAWWWTIGTQSLFGGKYYFEVKVQSCNNSWASPWIGVTKYDNINRSLSDYAADTSNVAVYSVGSSVWVVGVAYDSTTGNVWFRNTSGNWTSGDPTAGTSPAKTMTWAVYPFMGTYHDGTNYGFSSINFGQLNQSDLTYSSDAGWYFKYTPPAGFKALSSANLPDPTIKNPKQYFDVATWTGDGNATKSFTGLAFQPDFVWLKNRDISADFSLHDSVRWATFRLRSNQTYTEGSEAMQSFDASWFTLLWGGWVSNVSGNKFVSWNWKAGWVPSTNNSGTISSQVSVNPTAGFSIVSWTGASGTATIGHGLGMVPKFIITKYRNLANSWNLYHSWLGAGYRIFLDQTAVSSASTSMWNNTTPTSTSFSVGDANGNASNGTYVAYVWSEVPWFSKFGSYTGNASSDGPFIYTGFRPKYVMIKLATNTAADWIVADTTRVWYNPITTWLRPNWADPEFTNTAHSIDFLSNGFKIRGTDNAINYSGGTLIYAAFAEAPFKYADAK